MNSMCSSLASVWKWSSCVHLLVLLRDWGKKKVKNERNKRGGLQWLHSRLLLFILLLNSPSTKNTSHSVIPSPCLCLSLSPTLQQTTAQSATMGTAVLRYSTSRELGVGGWTRWGSESILGGGLVRRDWIAIISNIALISDYVAQ